MANEPDTRITALITVVVLGLCIQLALAFADLKETPSEAAINFLQAYYKLDPDLSDRVCEDQKVIDDVDVVDAYLYAKTSEAAQMGFGKGWKQHKLGQIEIEALAIDEKSASFQVSAQAHMEINPLFSWVAGLFRIGESHPVENKVDLILEDGRWKVCGGDFFSS